MTDHSHVKNDNMQIEFEKADEAVSIRVKLPLSQFHAIEKVMRKRTTMNVLCAAARRTGLDKALEGSTWCAACVAKVEHHQFDAKNGFNAFWDALRYCKGSFQLSKGECMEGHGPVTYHD